MAANPIDISVLHVLKAYDGALENPDREILEAAAGAPGGTYTNARLLDEDEIRKLEASGQLQKFIGKYAKGQKPDIETFRSIVEDRLQKARIHLNQKAKIGDLDIKLEGAPLAGDVKTSREVGDWLARAADDRLRTGAWGSAWARMTGAHTTLTFAEVVHAVNEERFKHSDSKWFLWTPQQLWLTAKTGRLQVSEARVEKWHPPLVDAPAPQIAPGWHPPMAIDPFTVAAVAKTRELYDAAIEFVPANAKDPAGYFGTIKLRDGVKGREAFLEFNRHCHFLEQAGFDHPEFLKYAALRNLVLLGDDELKVPADMRSAMREIHAAAWLALHPEAAATHGIDPAKHVQPDAAGQFSGFGQRLRSLYLSLYKGSTMHYQGYENRGTWPFARMIAAADEVLNTVSDGRGEALQRKMFAVASLDELIAATKADADENPMAQQFRRGVLQQMHKAGQFLVVPQPEGQPPLTFYDENFKEADDATAKKMYEYVERLSASSMDPANPLLTAEQKKLVAGFREAVAATFQRIEQKIGQGTPGSQTRVFGYSMLIGSLPFQATAELDDTTYVRDSCRQQFGTVGASFCEVTTSAAKSEKTHGQSDDVRWIPAAFGEFTRLKGAFTNTLKDYRAHTYALQVLVADPKSRDAEYNKLSGDLEGLQRTLLQHAAAIKQLKAQLILAGVDGQALDARVTLPAVTHNDVARLVPEESRGLIDPILKDNPQRPDTIGDSIDLWDVGNVAINTTLRLFEQEVEKTVRIWLEQQVSWARTVQSQLKAGLLTAEVAKKKMQEGPDAETKAGHYQKRQAALDTLYGMVHSPIRIFYALLKRAPNAEERDRLSKRLYAAAYVGFNKGIKTVMEAGDLYLEQIVRLSVPDKEPADFLTRKPAAVRGWLGEITATLTQAIAATEMSTPDNPVRLLGQDAPTLFDAHAIRMIRDIKAKRNGSKDDKAKGKKSQSEKIWDDAMDKVDAAYTKRAAPHLTYAETLETFSHNQAAASDRFVRWQTLTDPSQPNPAPGIDLRQVLGKMGRDSELAFFPDEERPAASPDQIRYIAFTPQIHLDEQSKQAIGGEASGLAFPDSGIVWSGFDVSEAVAATATGLLDDYSLLLIGRTGIQRKLAELEAKKPKEEKGSDKAKERASLEIQIKTLDLEIERFKELWRDLKTVAPHAPELPTLEGFKVYQDRAEAQVRELEAGFKTSLDRMPEEDRTKFHTRMVDQKTTTLMREALLSFQKQAFPIVLSAILSDTDAVTMLMATLIVHEVEHVVYTNGALEKAARQEGWQRLRPDGLPMEPRRWKAELMTQTASVPNELNSMKGVEQAIDAAMLEKDRWSVGQRLVAEAEQRRLKPTMRRAEMMLQIQPALRKGPSGVPPVEAIRYSDIELPTGAELAGFHPWDGKGNLAEKQVVRLSAGSASELDLTTYPGAIDEGEDMEVE